MTSRRLLVLSWLALAGCVPASRKAGPGALAPETASTYAYVGASGEVFAYHVDRISGKLTARGSVGVGKVSLLAADPLGRRLYAASDSGGDVSAFAIRPRNGALAPLGRASVRASGASSLILHRNGKYVLATTSGGQVVVFAVRPDGSLGPAEPYPSGPGSAAVALNPQLDFAFVLTPAAITQFTFNTGTGILTPSRDKPITFPARTNPRRIAFHPSGRFAYILQEGAGQIAGYVFEPTSGTLSSLAFQTVPVAPPPAAGGKAAARIRGGDLQVAARFLYAIDRGHETIATFAIDAETGALTLVGHQEARGQPRALALAEGKLNPILLVAHQGSLSSFHVDATTGALGHAESRDLRGAPTALAAATVRPE